jgi:hypothetical protein
MTEGETVEPNVQFDEYKGAKVKERADDINGSLRASVIDRLYSSIVAKEVPDNRGEARENNVRLVVQFTRIGGIMTKTAAGKVKDVCSRSLLLKLLAVRNPSARKLLMTEEASV